MQQMIMPDEAREIVLLRAGVLPAQTIAHADALHRVLAEDVESPLDLPPFDNSAMDGYAVVADDLKSASQNVPQTLRLLETIGAGEVAYSRRAVGDAGEFGEITSFSLSRAARGHYHDWRGIGEY